MTNELTVTAFLNQPAMRKTHYKVILNGLHMPDDRSPDGLQYTADPWLFALCVGGRPFADALTGEPGETRTCHGYRFEYCVHPANL